MDTVVLVSLFLKSNCFLSLLESGKFSVHDLDFVENGCGGYNFNNLIVDSIFNGYLQGFADGVYLEKTSEENN